MVSFNPTNYKSTVSWKYLDVCISDMPWVFMNLNPSWDMSISSLPSCLGRLPGWNLGLASRRGSPDVADASAAGAASLATAPGGHVATKVNRTWDKHHPSQLTVAIVTVTSRITSVYTFYILYFSWFRGSPLTSHYYCGPRHPPASPAMRFLPRKVCTSWRRNCHRLP